MIYQRKSAMHMRDRELAGMPLVTSTEASPSFWRYIAGWGIFLAVLVIVGNIIEGYAA